MIRGNCKRRVIFGKTGSGKSLLARNLVQLHSKVLYYDSTGHDYTDGVICEGLDQLKRYWRRVGPSRLFRIVYRSFQPRRDFAEVCKLVLSYGDMTFLVDEVDMYFDKSEPCPEFADLIRRGRHEDIELIGVSQRPRQLGEIRSMAHELYIFDTHEPSDLGYYKQSFSDHLVEKIKQLKQYEYVKVILPYEENNLQICKEDYAKPAESKTITESAEVDRSSESGDQVGLLHTDGGQDRQD